MATRLEKLEKGGEKIEKQRTLRQQIRDVSRLLSRERIPESVRQTKERVLNSLKQELAEKLEEKRCRKNSKKYRMVKFFDKRKVNRRLKMKMKLSDDCLPEDRVEINKELSELRMRLNYIEHYPVGFKYIALYPSDDKTSIKAIARREKIMTEISEKVANGNLPDACSKSTSCTHLGDRSQIGDNIRGASRSLRHPHEEGKRKIKRRVTVDEEPESDSEMESSKKFSGDAFFLDLTGDVKLS